MGLLFSFVSSLRIWAERFCFRLRRAILAMALDMAERNPSLDGKSKGDPDSGLWRLW
jgi:hypothetical protein